jgi:hypothetical protein
MTKRERLLIDTEVLPSGFVLDLKQLNAIAGIHEFELVRRTPLG